MTPSTSDLDRGDVAEDGVVVHVAESDLDKHGAVLRNVGNLLEDLGPGTAVELVVHGAGIGLCLSSSPHAQSVQRLIDAGVVVVACRNTLTAKQIDLDELGRGVTVVPAGIGELVRKQRAGWAYVRP